MSNADLAILLSLKDEADAGFERSRSKWGGFGGIIAGGVAAAGAAVAAGTAIGVKAAGDLEQAVANISTIKPEVDTSAVFAALNEMQTRVPQSAAALGEGLYNVFSSMEVSQEQALALTEKFAQGATAAQTDAATFGTAVMGVLNAYGLSAEDATHISDVFFNTVNKGVVTGQELASSLGPVTQAAKSAGVGVDQLGAMIAAVTKEGGPAAQNINNLNNFLQKVSTGPARTELEKLGIATTDGSGKLREIPAVLEDLKAKLAGMSQAEAIDALQHIFPDAQARQGAQTLMSQLDLVKSATLDNAAAVGVADEAYKKMSATFNSQVTLAGQAVMSVLTTLGAAILPAITPLITAFAQWLPGAFQAAQTALAPLASALSAQLGPAIASIVAALPTIVTLLGGFFAAFTGGSMEAIVNARAILEGIFGPQITDMLVNLTSVAGQAFSAIASFAVEQFGAIVSWVQENWPLIQQTIMVVLAAIATLWDTYGGQIITIVQSAWTIVSTAISTALQVILGIVRMAMQLITGDWEGAWQTLLSTAGTLLSGLATIVGAAFTGLLAIVDLATGGMLTAIGTWISDTATAIGDGMQAVSDTVSSGWQAVSDFVAGILPAIASAIMTVWNAIPEDIRADLVLIATHIATSAVTWVANLVTAGANMLTAISTALTNMVTAVTTWATSTFLAPITGLATTAGTAATSVGSGMLTAITAKLGEIITAVTTWATSTFLTPIQNMVGTVTSAAQSVGQAIVNGVISGIQSIASRIGETLANIARSALQRAKELLDIHSPSGVAEEEIGVPVGQGIVRGLERLRSPIAASLAGLVAPPSVPATAVVGAGLGAVDQASGPLTLRIFLGNRELRDWYVETGEALDRQGRAPWQ